MIIKGDKIKLVQKIGSFDKVGDIFEVTGVDNGVVSFKCNYGTGCMSYDEFERYFEKLKRENGVTGLEIQIIDQLSLLVMEQKLQQIYFIEVMVKKFK